ncbi:helix-turn-helix domain-containing protein [Alkalicoccobacillus porphyridii]|uniref:Helix-turn-helix domain-containing protein n=1 Tax=Alkalicoccobacillus porphyridii TaxID=2597270 RepID=A0A553ZZH9_9BACI|nr:XRE family transcriptional regulator [Alkalicoccobacillus porphyridii]TSB46850.1 helix-turn-helix domain-containing protein [Alkalicoccobacillus porphyridii]
MSSFLSEKQLAAQFGRMLRKVRSEKELSLQELSEQADVSKLTLGNIERGEANPSLTVIWKIANALNIPISTLLQESQNVVVSKSHSGSRVYSPGEVCVLEPMFADRVYGPLEVHRAFLKARSTYSPGKHQKGVVEIVTVMKGEVTISVDNQQTLLQTYDSMKFEADVAHAYTNETDDEAVLHFVMTYT